MPRPLFFMHVAKTGGTSLVGYLDRHFGVEDSLFQASAGAHALYRMISSPHSFPFDRYACVEAHAPYNLIERFPKRPATITILRDPVERLISHYRHDRRSNADTRASKAAKGMDVLGYCEIAERSCDPYNPAAAYLLGKTHVEPGDDVSHLLSKIDYVGTLPRLSDLCHVLAGAHGWRPPREAPRLRSINSAGIENLDPETKETLRNRCWADYLLFQQAEARIGHDIAKLRRKLINCAGMKLGYRLLRILGKEMSTYDLLMRSYMQNFQRTSAELDLTFDRPISGDGWHLRETDRKGNYWRWTGPSNAALLDLPVDNARDLEINVWIINTGSQATFDSLSFKVNGEHLQHSTRIENGQIVCTIKCPVAAARRGFAATLEICTPVQNEIPLVDPATPVPCGVAVSRVQVNPL